MRIGRTVVYLITALCLFLVSCATKPAHDIFLNQAYRQDLSLNDEELKSLQFFISTNVYVQYDSPEGKKTILLREQTPGVATSSGPDWLKVSFREGGVDIPFVADQRADYDMYYIATELPGKTGFHMIKELPEKTFYHEGTPYRVIHGEKAHLLVDAEGLAALAKKRITTKGRRVKPN
jgi:hypothetical protein